jgi:hypothetical protein
VRGLPTHQRQISGRDRYAAKKKEHPLNRIISIEDDAQVDRD